MLSRPQNALLRYGVPVAIVLSTAIVKLLLQEVAGADSSPFLLFFGAILASALYGGMAAGVLATALAALFAHAVFLASPAAPALQPLVPHDGPEVLQIGLFLLEGLAISAVSAALQGARRGAEARELDAQNQEEALRATEERYRLLVDNVQDYAILMLDADGRIVSWNPGAERAYGYTAEEIVGRHYSVFHQEADRVMGLPEIEFDIVLREERVESVGWRLRKDGTRFWASVLMTALRDLRGELRGFSKMTRDITERKRAEDERTALLAREQAARGRAEASERYHRLLSETIPQIVWTARPDGYVDYFNQRWSDYTGHTVEETRGWAWQAVLHPDDRAGAVARWRQAIRTGEVYEAECRFRRAADGTARWHLVRALPVRDLDGNVIQWFGTCTDIDERKRAEQASRFLAEATSALSSSLDEEQALARVARLAVPRMGDWCLVDLAEEGGERRRVAAVHADPARQELVEDLELGAPAGAPETRGIARVLGSGEPDLAEDLPEAELAGLAPDAGQLARLRALSVRSYVCVALRARGRTLGALTLGSGEPGRRFAFGDLVAVEELARRAALALDNARLFREAQRSNRVKDEFLSTLSHELRTPMTSILGWTQMLRTGELDPATAERGLDVIHRSARQQAQLIEDLLDISRIITGKLRLEMHPVELTSAIEAAVHALQPAAEAREIRLETQLEAAAPVHGDPDRLQQVVWNVLSNAIKFTPPGGRVEVRLERSGSQVRIVVSDTGKGIDPAFLPYVFNRFSQADGSTTRSHGGLGLGLAIVRHLVELHGGTVHAHSDGEDRGSVFTVALPVRAVHAGEPEERGEVGPVAAAGHLAAPGHTDVLAGVRMLVVDDEPEGRDLLSTVLRWYGAEVTAVGSASEALAELGRGPQDVLVSDIGMPDKDGYALIREIRALEPERGGRIPAAAVTAYAADEDRSRVLASGFQIHVTKPVEPDALAKAVARLARRDSSAIPAPSPEGSALPACRDGH
ncbi:MAG: PAS domain S-box protein [Gemmatimonadota bacterium]